MAEQQEDITIREATPEDASGIARVHVDSWRTTYRGMMPDQLLDNLSYESRAHRWEQILSDPAGAGFTYVAQDRSGQIVGFASGGPDRDEDPRYQGELWAIYLLEEYQGRGIGRRLTQAVARRLADMGMHSMIVWVLADNPARRFYEALGGQYVGERDIEINGAKLREVAYGWADTSHLL
jgi:ribosomal protein S18 acetylase RimI-like enzyme